jgi:hypothetical protein
MPFRNFVSQGFCVFLHGTSGHELVFLTAIGVDLLTDALIKTYKTLVS